MSDIFQRVAAVHRERVAKAEKTRLLRKKKLAAQQAYFKDTGIPEMWDAIKNIVIPNKMPDVFEGYTITIGDLFVTTSPDNIEQTALVVRTADGDSVGWFVEDHSDDTDEQAKIWYRATAGKNTFCLPHDNKDAKQNFVNSFVKWASRHITPQMLLDMNIDLDVPSVTKRSRKILQLAET